MRQSLGILLLFGLVLLLPAQESKPNPASSETAQRRTDPQFDRQRNEKTPLQVEWEKKLEKRRNAERHRSLKEDTDELLKLATELKQYVDETDENMMSVDVIEKAKDIEKLAKKVREKMKGY